MRDIFVLIHLRSHLLGDPPERRERDTRNLEIFTLVYLMLRCMPVLRSSSCYCYGGWIVPLNSPADGGVAKWYHALAREAPYREE